MYVVYGITDCPSCLRAEALLMEKEQEYVVVTMDFSPSFRKVVKEKFNWNTFPIVVFHQDDSLEDPKVVGGFEQLNQRLLWDPMVGQSN